MDEAFAHAIRPPVRAALRLRLEPFTLGHWFLLARWCPEFVDHEHRSGVNLPLAVVICAVSHRAAARLMSSWWLRSFFLLWGWRCRRVDLAVELIRFNEYLRESMAGPSFNCRVDGAGEANSPAGFWLASVLMAEFGMTWDQAMDTTFSLALALYAARAESQGKIELASSRTRRLWEFIRQKRESAALAATN